MTKRNIASIGLLLAGLALVACNTVRGAGEDAKSVGRVFSDHPNGNK
jgi:predicted small secreted protein